MHHRNDHSVVASAGTSIFALLSSPLSRGLFQRAISLSGSPNITMDLRTAEAQNAPVVEQLGCANNETSWEERLQCLRDVPANVVPSAMPHSWTTPGQHRQQRNLVETAD